MGWWRFSVGTCLCPVQTWFGVAGQFCPFPRHSSLWACAGCHTADHHKAATLGWHTFWDIFWNFPRAVQSLRWIWLTTGCHRCTVVNCSSKNIYLAVKNNVAWPKVAFNFATFWMTCCAVMPLSRGLIHSASLREQDSTLVSYTV